MQRGRSEGDEECKEWRVVKILSFFSSRLFSTGAVPSKFTSRGAGTAFVFVFTTQ